MHQQQAKTLAKKLQEALASMSVVSLPIDARNRISSALNAGLSLAGEFGGDVCQADLGIQALEKEVRPLAHGQVLDVVARANGFKDWNAMSACAPKDGGDAVSVFPDFEALRDKRMCDLTPAQQEDARELWLRENLAAMPDYHRAFYEFLLGRLDTARKAAAPADQGNPPRLGRKDMALLNNLEWAGQEHDEHGNLVAACPSCGAEKSSGKHDEGCELHAALTTTEQLPGATVSEIGEVYMPDLFEYETPEKLPAWKWIEKNASFEHTSNMTEPGVWEFVINLAREFDDIPAELAPLIRDARAKDLAYLIFHQG